MLYYYVERKRKENLGAQLHVTYLVSGRLEEDGTPCHKVAVVREDQLEAVKTRMAGTASVHVYSIHKAMLRDSGPLFNTDYDAIKGNLESCNKYSAIRCADAVPRSAEEMARLHKSLQTRQGPGQPPNSSTKPTVNGSLTPATPKPAAQTLRGVMSMFSTKPSSKPQEVRTQRAEPSEESIASSSTSRPASKGSSTLSNFFSKAGSKMEESPRHSPSPALKRGEIPNKSDPELPEKGGSWGKSPQSVEELGKSAEKEGPRAPSVRCEATEGPHEKEARISAQTATADRKPERAGRGTKKNKRGEVLDTEETEPRNKRRCRIRLPSDSSEDEVIPDSPPAACDVRTPSPPPEVLVKEEPPQRPVSLKAAVGRSCKRRRVLKSKTFADEDGSIVTEKAYVSESCTDSESEATGGPRKLVSGPGKASGKEEARGKERKPIASSKQASIMGFFKKAN
ncbi:DNA polymerase delta subunit 3 isoform X2 [Callorhinchus milii]|nr:DNA polymerase delta subunit 3 isoform X2 [Callorhinchus milii]